MNLTKRTDAELRALQDEALLRCFETLDQAKEVNRELIDYPSPGGTQYREMADRHRELIAVAQRWGDLVPRITVELERRAQARLANAEYDANDLAGKMGSGWAGEQYG